MNKKAKSDIIGLVFALLVIAVGIYLSFFAPCESLMWLSVRALPVRCLAAALR